MALGFAEFAGQQGRIDPSQLAESVEPFLARLATRLSSAAKVKHILNGFLRFLRQTGVLAIYEPKVSPDPHLEPLEVYSRYLHRQRSLKERTIRQICGTCRTFMAFLAADRNGSLRSLQPQVIHRFLISRGRRCRRSTLRTQSSSLRGFLAYLHRCGAMDYDVSGAVIAPRVYQHDRCPRFLTRPQIEAVLAVIDRSTLVGRRDYAMLLLLSLVPFLSNCSLVFTSRLPSCIHCGIASAVHHAFLGLPVPVPHSRVQQES